MLLDEPQDDELSGLIAALVTEVDEALRSDAWVLLDKPSITVRVHSGAALWHCCVLLTDLDSAGIAAREVNLRLLARAHIEAWIVALFIHYGEIDALEKLAADLRRHFQIQHDEGIRYDKKLTKELRRIEKANRQIREDNAGKSEWNVAHPEMPPKQLRAELRAASRPLIGMDLSAPIAKLSGVDAKSLPFTSIISELNRLAKAKAFGEENFDVIYIVAYRLLSAVGAHPTLEVVNSYIGHHESANFVRVSREMNSPSFDPTVRHTSLMATAFLANRVLAEAGGTSPVADEILNRYSETP